MQMQMLASPLSSRFRSEQDILLVNDQVVVIADKYPKARFEVSPLDVTH
jgi:hypothetical protein